MSEQKLPTVYLVCTGTYSDFTVRAVFDTREAADELVKLRFYHGWDDPAVLEFALNKLAQDVTLWEAFVYDGDAQELTVYEWLDEPGYVGLGKDTGLQFSRENPGPKGLRWWRGRGKTREQAIKVAQDKRAEWKARKAGVV